MPISNTQSPIQMFFPSFLVPQKLCNKNPIPRLDKPLLFSIFILSIRAFSPIRVMQERVEFVMRIGLNIDDMNAYPHMLGCSMRNNMIPILDYLEKIGIHRSKLDEFVKSHPQVLHTSIVIDLVPVVKFLQGIDIERQDIAYVL
ncbi:hypothetical protein EJ110_NYTH50946 [Nymphaea thermarum]|nr:hypothetical protein EJ110_NYTH50946 [Nymphaea thermarum]